MMKYKHAIQLYKNFNVEQEKETWLQLNFQQNYTARNDKILIYDNSTSKDWKKIINCFNMLNEMINYDWLTFSIKCKNEQLSDCTVKTDK